jgi:hypothetical protein
MAQSVGRSQSIFGAAVAALRAVKIPDCPTTDQLDDLRSRLENQYSVNSLTHSKSMSSIPPSREERMTTLVNNMAVYEHLIKAPHASFQVGHWILIQFGRFIVCAPTRLEALSRKQPGDCYCVQIGSSDVLQCSTLQTKRGKDSFYYTTSVVFEPAHPERVIPMVPKVDTGSAVSTLFESNANKLKLDVETGVKLLGINGEAVLHFGFRCYVVVQNDNRPLAFDTVLYGARYQLLGMDLLHLIQWVHEYPPGSPDLPALLLSYPQERCQPGFVQLVGRWKDLACSGGAPAELAHQQQGMISFLSKLDKEERQSCVNFLLTITADLADHMTLADGVNTLVHAVTNMN